MTIQKTAAPPIPTRSRGAKVVKTPARTRTQGKPAPSPSAGKKTPVRKEAPVRKKIDKDMDLKPISSMKESLLKIYDLFATDADVLGWFSDKGNKFVQFMVNKEFAGRSFPQVLNTITKMEEGEEWGPATSEALNSAYLITSMISNLAQKFNPKAPSNKEALDFLSRAIKTGSFVKDQKRKERISSIINKYLNVIIESIPNFIEDLISASQEHDTKEFALPKQNKSKLTADEYKAKTDLSNQNIPYVQIPDQLSGQATKSSPILYKDLSNIENFKNYLKNNNVKIQDKNAWEGDGPRQVIDYIKKQVVALKDKNNLGF